MNRNRKAFTLIELLVAIAIMALIAAMSTMYIRRTYRSAMEKNVLGEISKLTDAMSAYRSKNAETPPAMGAISRSLMTASLTSQGFTSREDAFDMHMRRRFPRCTAASTIGSGSTAPSNSIYVNVRTGNLSNLLPYGYNYMTSTGSTAQLDLNTMDQAEALVFWLAGFPSPVGSNGIPLASRKTIGFNRNEQNPFYLRKDASSPINLDSRTEPDFPFVEARLVDTDQDGWLEYLPSLPAGTSHAAPFVYFDAKMYSAMAALTSSLVFNAYPSLDTGNPPFSPMHSLLEREWGIAVPMALEIRTAGTINWHRPSDFQIICAGYDGKYGTPGEGSLFVPMYPAGQEFLISGGSFTGPQGLDMEAEDNLTNFATSRLGAGMVGR